MSASMIIFEGFLGVILMAERRFFFNTGKHVS